MISKNTKPNEKVIIGCDPDSDKSGIAVYVNNELEVLKSMSLMGFINELQNLKDIYEEIELHIEDVKGNKCSSFNWVKMANKAKERRVNAKISEKVGMCKQVQSEIERIAEYFDVKIVHHKVSPRWKKTGEKALFERATGWTKQSNEDTRSAAYFGFMGCRK